MYIYVISDVLEQPGYPLISFILQRFPGIEVEIVQVKGVADREKLENVVQEAGKKEALIFHTIVDEDMRSGLQQMMDQLGIAGLDLLAPITGEIARFLGLKPQLKSPGQEKLDKEYFRRVEAIEFAVRCDDGRDLAQAMKADLVLIGVSRTSKTPLSIYLANEGYRVANIPLMPEVSPPRELFLLPARRITGLTIEPETLQRIRQERLKVMGIPRQTEYASFKRIVEELEYARQIMSKIGCLVEEVTDRSLEELAFMILKEKGEL